MRALKLIMVVMGLLIVAGVAVLGVTISQRMSTPKLAAPALLEEPGGTRIGTISSSGERVVLLLQGGGPDRIVIIDIRNGQVIAKVGLAR